MANVKITREHNLGIAQAMIRARGLVDGLAEQYGLKTSWSEDRKSTRLNSSH